MEVWRNVVMTEHTVLSKTCCQLTHPAIIKLTWLFIFVFKLFISFVVLNMF